MMNRGVMDRQMFRNGGAAFPDLSGDGRVTQRDILMGRGVIPMQQGGNPALEASIAAFMKQYGPWAPLREKSLLRFADASGSWIQRRDRAFYYVPDGPSRQSDIVPIDPSYVGPYGRRAGIRPTAHGPRRRRRHARGFCPGPVSRTSAFHQS
jgi:hypothetical protein